MSSLPMQLALHRDRQVNIRTGRSSVYQHVSCRLRQSCPPSLSLLWSLLTIPHNNNNTSQIIHTACKTVSQPWNIHNLHVNHAPS